jgi:glycosyltransferase involved in cell wall biosynthesis
MNLAANASRAPRRRMALATRSIAPRSRPLPLAPAGSSVERATALQVACFATQGTGSGDEARLVALLAPLAPQLLPFDRARKTRSSTKVLWHLVRQRPDIVITEGTGLGGGLALMAARLLGGIPYIVSSGDAIAPYLALTHPWLRLPGSVYEHLLCRLAAGYVGWSPYLAGRAISFGAPRAMTAAHWAGVIPTSEERQRLRAAVRAELGIPDDAVVVGLVGSLTWAKRRSYCYGLELVRAARQTSRGDLRILIVGDGTGRRRLEMFAGDDLGRRILLPGAVSRERVMEMLCAMDVASLPQSLDQVGAVRYTTKLSEYLAAGVPVVTGQLPLAYDLDDGWLWRLQGAAPWDPRYVADMARFLATVDRAAASARGSLVPRRLPLFDFGRQQRAVNGFVVEVVDSHRGA